MEQALPDRGICFVPTYQDKEKPDATEDIFSLMLSVRINNSILPIWGFYKMQKCSADVKKKKKKGFCDDIL